MTLYRQFEHFFNTRGAVMKVLVGIIFMSTIFCAPAYAANRIQKCNQLGKQLGEAAFNVTHPDPLGQMSFDASDFSK
jgi:hypothetical protein